MTQDLIADDIVVDMLNLDAGHTASPTTVRPLPPVPHQRYQPEARTLNVYASTLSRQQGTSQQPRVVLLLPHDLLRTKISVKVAETMRSSERHHTPSVVITVAPGNGKVSFHLYCTPFFTSFPPDISQHDILSRVGCDLSMIALT